MDAFGERAKMPKSSLAFTLPISCQICLGKVKDPACCGNSHVFCKLCIQIWTEKNKFCPTCRVPLQDSSAYRILRGGECLEDEERPPEFSDAVVRKARLHSLFNSYEEEILRLNDLVLKLTTEIHDSHPRGDTASPKATSSGGPCATTQQQQSDLIDALNQQLQEVTERYQQVADENERLKSQNSHLHMEVDQLKWSLMNASPRKGFGSRFTVASLERQIEDYKKEIAGLVKALAHSDNQIKELHAKLSAGSAGPANEDILSAESRTTDAHLTTLSRRPDAQQTTMSHRPDAPLITRPHSPAGDTMSSHIPIVETVTSDSVHKMNICGSRSCPEFDLLPAEQHQKYLLLPEGLPGNPSASDHMQQSTTVGRKFKERLYSSPIIKRDVNCNSTSSKCCRETESSKTYSGVVRIEVKSCKEDEI